VTDTGAWSNPRAHTRFLQRFHPHACTSPYAPNPAHPCSHLQRTPTHHNVNIQCNHHHFRSHLLVHEPECNRLVTNQRLVMTLRVRHGALRVAPAAQHVRICTAEYTNTKVTCRFELPIAPAVTRSMPSTFLRLCCSRLGCLLHVTHRLHSALTISSMLHSSSFLCFSCDRHKQAQARSWVGG
jgi:hypothetical protein